MIFELLNFLLPRFAGKLRALGSDDVIPGWLGFVSPNDVDEVCRFHEVQIVMTELSVPFRPQLVWNEFGISADRCILLQLILWKLS
jgi:hypothetical protein